MAYRGPRSLDGIHADLTCIRKIISWVLRARKYLYPIASKEKNILDYVCLKIRCPEKAWVFNPKGERDVFKLSKIYIARHGETTWNEEGRIQGRSDPGLSSKGVSQSFALLNQLKDRPLSAIYTSTLQRSIVTAQPISNHLGLSIQIQPELDEIAFGILEAKLLFHFDEEMKAEWNRFKDNRFTYRIPDAENYADVANRVQPFSEKLLRDHQGQEVLVVGHRVVNRLLIGMLMKYPVEKVLKIEQTNDMLYLIQKNGEAKIFHYVDGQVREGLVLLGQEVIL